MQRASKVAFHTLGCKLNYSETASIADQFKESGFESVDFNTVADLYVINTCSVTENADKECKKYVNKVKRNAPDATVAVIGCYAQLKPDIIKNIAGVDIVLGASEKFKIVEHFSNFNKAEPIVLGCDINTIDEFIPSQSRRSRTRSFIKVQDGCDYACTFCTIPLARGKSRSDTVENVIQRIKTLISEGAKEIVLSGINLGDFTDRSNGQKRNLTDLLRAIDMIDELERLRISSIEPNLITDELIDLVAKSSKIMPHFHIPLQSGSDKILAAMRRRYRTALYKDRINKIKSRIPNCCIGADVIVGFPGETDADFRTTVNFINELELSYLHPFTYSERDNTIAAEMNEVVPADVRAKRSFILRSLSAKLRRQFYNEQLDSNAVVLFESDNKDGYMHGFTENYVKVRIQYDPDLINKTVKCNLKSIGEDNVVELSPLDTIFA